MAVPRTAPVSPSSPEGRSMATIGFREAFISVIAVADNPCTGAFRPVPKMAYTTRSLSWRRGFRIDASWAVVSTARQRQPDRSYFLRLVAAAPVQADGAASK